MAITQAQANKDWKDAPDTSTLIMAADLEAISRAVRDRKFLIPSSTTSVDEFDDDSLDAAWTRVDPASVASSISWSEGGDSLSCNQLAGGTPANQIHGLIRPLSGIGGALAVGDGFVTAVTHFGPTANFLMAGIVLTDSTAAGAGGQVAALSYGTGANGDQMTNNIWNGTGWSLSGQAGDVMCRSGCPIFLRLSLIAANTWRHDISPNGVAWMTGPATLTKTLTPTHVGLVGSLWGTSTKGVMSYEFLRRVSGVS
ncbi:hypothetical protein [Terrabacter terrigena]|uniref:Uncharacterized protein n=1 Tax=Terrabacter terrigena TaxID=574718 RepID=A0ABW3MWE3_9MICO